MRHRHSDVRARAEYCVDATQIIITLVILTRSIFNPGQNGASVNAGLGSCHKGVETARAKMHMKFSIDHSAFTNLLYRYITKKMINM